MSLGRRPEEGLVEGFPRVSGDEPRQYDHVETVTVFSPRERG